MGLEFACAMGLLLQTSGQVPCLTLQCAGSAGRGLPRASDGLGGTACGLILILEGEARPGLAPEARAPSSAQMALWPPGRGGS